MAELAAPARERRLRRLREELEDAGVFEAVHDGLLSEIDRARFPRRHEGRFPSYGAIVVDDGVGTSAIDGALDAVGATRLDSGPIGHETVRRMADGIHSFALVRRSRLSLVLLASDVLREVELVQLRRALGLGVSIVSRSVEGVVRVVQNRQIVTFDGTAWWSKPDAHEYAAFVSSALRDVPTGLVEHILDFCVHVAGPGVAGATLIWCVDQGAETALDHVAAATEAPLPVRLSFADARSQAPIWHLLVHTDGACRLNPSAELIQVGLHLRASGAAFRSVRVRSDRGTRHASAKRCSFDVPTAVVFVISEDGPVTAFAGGQVVASINTPAIEAGAKTL
jgi:hypothetical protein